MTTDTVAAMPTAGASIRTDEGDGWPLSLQQFVFGRFTQGQFLIKLGEAMLAVGDGGVVADVSDVRSMTISRRDPHESHDSETPGTPLIMIPAYRGRMGTPIRSHSSSDYRYEGFFWVFGDGKEFIFSPFSRDSVVTTDSWDDANRHMSAHIRDLEFEAEALARGYVKAS